MAHMLYTYLRRRRPSAYAVAVSDNAAPPTYTTFVGSTERSVIHEKAFSTEKQIIRTSTDSNSVSSSSRSSFCDDLRLNGQRVALFPQYSCQEQVTLMIREDMLPNLPGSFTVFKDNQRLFEVDRERPSATHRTNIVDAETQTVIMAVRKNFGTIPVSFSFEDPSGKRLVDLEGEFFVPHSGAKSTAHMINAETGNKLDLSMKGSYLNRHAVIKDENGEVLVRMISNIFEARSIVGHRRTYELKVRAGVDLSLAVAMIIALHCRESK
jgi:hypothetical protein